MSARTRAAFAVVSCLGLAAVLGAGLSGLPDFGHYAGPYGDVISKLVKPQRSIANAVTATVFDYRGFDTLGEELILLAAASGAVMLLREVREHSVDDVVDPVRSDGLRAAGAVAAIAVFLLGLQVVTHGFVTPGGGFQGGVVIASSVALLFLAISYRSFHTVGSDSIAEPIEGFGVGLFVALALWSLVEGHAFLENVIRHGMFGRVQAGGSVQLVNWASGIAVAAAFVVLFGEVLQEAMAGCHKAGERS